LLLLLTGLAAYRFLPADMSIHSGSGCTSRTTAAIEVPVLLVLAGGAASWLGHVLPRLQLPRVLGAGVVVATVVYVMYVVAYLGTCSS
jgi:hypothetical protein